MLLLMKLKDCSRKSYCGICFMFYFLADFFCYILSILFLIYFTVSHL